MVGSTRAPTWSVRQGQRPEAIAEDHLDDQTVRGRREPGADAEVQLPARAEVDVQDGEDQVLLVTRPIDPVDRPDVAVVLEAGGDARGDVVRDLGGRREPETSARVLALERALERGIERPVPAAELLIDDRADLEHGLAGRGQLAAVDLDLEVPLGRRWRRRQQQRQQSRGGGERFQTPTPSGMMPSHAGVRVAYGGSAVGPSPASVVRRMTRR